MTFFPGLKCLNSEGEGVGVCVITRRCRRAFGWGTTGKAIRGAGRDAQVVALYLLTCPSANMIGLYYLPLELVAHDTGMPLHRGFDKILEALESVEFAFYDREQELVYVPEMARFQIEEILKPGDKRIIGVMAQLHEHGSHPFAIHFHEKYREAFNLPALIMCTIRRSRGAQG